MQRVSRESEAMACGSFQHTNALVPHATGALPESNNNKNTINSDVYTLTHLNLRSDLLRTSKLVGPIDSAAVECLFSIHAHFPTMHS